MSNSKLIVYGARVKPNRSYQIMKVSGGYISQQTEQWVYKEEKAVSSIMKGKDLFKEYGSIRLQQGHEVQRRRNSSN